MGRAPPRQGVVADQLRAHSQGHQLLTVKAIIAVQDVLEGLQEQAGEHRPASLVRQVEYLERRERPGRQTR